MHENWGHEGKEHPRLDCGEGAITPRYYIFFKQRLPHLTQIPETYEDCSGKAKNELGISYVSRMAYFRGFLIKMCLHNGGRVSLLEFLCGMDTVQLGVYGLFLGIDIALQVLWGKVGKR